MAAGLRSSDSLATLMSMRGGVKWYFLPTERLWLNGELIRVDHAPYSGAFTPYTAGMNGWVPMIQTVLAF